MAHSQSAQDALKARQGKGARYDAPSAPGDDLLLARRVTAYLARKLNELSDAELSIASADPSKTRAHIIAHISYAARREALLLEALSTQTAAPLAQIPSLDLAATLPARALRHLFEHSKTHLNVTWRDLGDPHWRGHIILPDIGEIAIKNLPKLRARAVLEATVNLRNGASLSDFPALA